MIKFYVLKMLIGKIMIRVSAYTSQNYFNRKYLNNKVKYLQQNLRLKELPCA